MKTFLIGASGFGLLASTALSLAGPASAATADSVINDLRADGYLVSINQTPTAPLTSCKVTSVSKTDVGFSASVDIACPQGCGGSLT